MNAAVHPTTQTQQRSYRTPVIVAAVLLLAMALIWWSFFTLREDQSVRVLFSAGTYSVANANSGATSAAQSASGIPAAGTSLSTGDDGFVTVQLSDGSVVKLMPNTSLNIEDARVNAASDRFATSLRLLSGEIETQIERGDGAEREVSLFSNSVAIGVRGTVFTVIQAAEQARLMVTRGNVEANGNVGDSVAVKANQGIVVASNAAVPEAVTLPAAPQPQGDAQSADDGMRVAWRTESPQPSYQLEVAQDESFAQLLKRQIVTWQRGTLPIIDRDGRYFWRVASIDASGLRGPYSDAFTLAQDYYLRRSRAALEQGDLKAVRENLALTDQAMDEDIDRLLERALAAISKQRFADATVDLEMVLALRAADAAARNALANAQFHLLDYINARKNFDQTLRIPGVDPVAAADAQTGIALIDVRRGQFDAALRRVREVLESRSEHLHALNVAAMASVGLGDRETAMKFLQQALRLQPNDPTASLLRQTLQAPPVNVPGVVPSAPGSGS